MSKESVPVLVVASSFKVMRFQICSISCCI